MRAAVPLVAVAAATIWTACGGGHANEASALRSCVEGRLPKGAYDRVVSSTEEGVTSLAYFHRGSEIDVAIFPDAAAATAAADAEARIGDAHDKRIRNVLYTGGGAVGLAVVRCLR